MKQIVVRTVFLDSDDYEVVSHIIPCDSMETAKKVVDKIYEKIVSNLDFINTTKDKWEEEYVERYEDGFFIQGNDCGHAEVDIVEEDVVTSNTLDSFVPQTAFFY